MMSSVAPSLAMFHTVELFGFYLAPMAFWAAAAVIPFVGLRWLLARWGAYRFIWHRSLFNLALYVLLVGCIVFLGNVFFGKFA